MVGIYKITNLINGKCYIGQSKDLVKRMNSHKTTAFDPLSHSYNNHLYRAIRKYGLENFSFDIIEYCKIEELNEKEKMWIEHYNSFFNGYNLTFGGDASGTSIHKDSVISIIKELETTLLTQKEIAFKHNISEEMVQGINTGRYWRHNRNYPIREKVVAQKYYCIDCGKEVFRKSIRCRDCEVKHRIIPLNKMPVSREELKNLIRNKTFTEIGSMFNVSDNAIRKWCEKFNLPRKKTIIKQYSEEEWETI